MAHGFSDRYLHDRCGEPPNSLPALPQGMRLGRCRLSTSRAGLPDSAPLPQPTDEIAASQSSPADRPPFMTVAHRAIECRPRAQRLLGGAADDGIAILNELLIDDPCPQFLTGEPCRDPVRC